MKFNYGTLLFFFTLFLPVFLTAQHNQVNYPLNKWSTIYLDDFLSTSDSIPNSTVRPYVVGQESLYQLPGFKQDTGIYYFNATKKLFGDNLIVLNKKDLYVTIDPILHLEVGKELLDNSAYADTAKNFINTRGFFVRGSLGKKLTFETFFSENQIFVPLYQRDFILDKKVAPGATIVKGFQTVGFDFGYAGGFFSYQPLKNWNIQFGHGKHFIGEGYRSVILSDNSMNYPYFRSSLDLLKGKVTLTSIFSSLQNITRLPSGDSPESLFQRKAMSLTTLSIAPIPRVRIGIIEGVIWQTFIPLVGDRDFDIRWINPLPFYNMASLSWNEVDNLFLGIDIALKPINQIQIYSQYMVDDNQRTSFQFGLKGTNLIDNIWLRVEHNRSNSYTGAHEIPLQSLTNGNLPLAHPLGAGFEEWIFQGIYTYDRWFLDLNLQIAEYDKDLEIEPGVFENLGINLLRPYFDEEDRPSGQKMARLNNALIRLGYKFNSFYNLTAFLSFQTRSFNGPTFEKEQNGLLTFGVRTELFNQYYDF